jgi:hypothetical protein
MSPVSPSRAVRIWDGTGWMDIATQGAQGPQGGGISRTFTYASDGDTNGAIYWIGAKGGTFAVPVPNTGSALVAEGFELRLDTSGLFSASFPLMMCVDRNTNTPTATSDVAGSWIRFDFRWRRLKPNRYSLRTRGDSDTGHPRSWVLEGSNDGSAWATLDTRTNDTQLTGLNKWVTYTCTATGNYEFLRIRQTAANSAALNYLAVGEIEFYGDLVDVTGGLNVSDTGWVTVTGPTYDTSASNPNPFQYRRVGNEMYIRGNLRTTIALGDGNSIAGVPAGGGPGYPGIINVLVNGVKETLDINTTGFIAIIGSGYTAAVARIWKLPFTSWRID